MLDDIPDRHQRISPPKVLSLIQYFDHKGEIHHRTIQSKVLSRCRVLSPTWTRCTTQNEGDEGTRGPRKAARMSKGADRATVSESKNNIARDRCEDVA